MKSESGSDEIPDLMMRLMRQFGIAKLRASAAHRDDAVPLYLLAKIGEGPPRRAGALAAELDADPSTVSRQVAQLVKDGLAERRADPVDGRAVNLVLTEAGQHRRQEMFRHRSRMFGAITADWSDSDLAAFAALLRRYVERFESQREELLADVLGPRSTPVFAHHNSETPSAADTSRTKDSNGRQH